MNPAVELEGISKFFYRHTGRALLRKHVEGWFRRGRKERFWALKDVGFRVDPGQGLALVGTMAPARVPC